MSLQTLTQKLVSSTLLSKEKKEQLLRLLPTLSAEQTEALEKVMDSENGVIGDMACDAIADAVRRNDTAYLHELDAIAKKGEKKLRKGEESLERSDEASQADNLFDALPDNNS